MDRATLGVSMPKRPRRLRRDELRELMLTTGVDLLRSDGLASGAGGLTYAEVFRRFEAETGIRVSRAQVHGRIWDSVDYFRTAVLAALAGYDPRPESEAAVAAAVAAIDRMNATTEQGRINALYDIVHTSAQANQETLRGELSWELSNAIRSLQMVAAHHDTSQAEITNALRQSDLIAEGFYLRHYRALATTLGVRLNPARTECTFDGAVTLFTKLSVALGAAIASRSRYFGDDRTGITINLGPDGTPQEWDAFAIGSLALVCYFFDLDPAGPALAGDTDLGFDQADTAHQPAPLDVAANIPRDVLRDRLVDVGVTLIRENGLGHGAEHLTYSRVFERIREVNGIRVVRAQVHNRIWDSQADYQDDVLARIADLDIAGFGTAFLERVGPDLGAIDFRNAATIWDGLQSLARTSAKVDNMRMTNSVDWNLFSGVATTNALRDNPPRKIADNVAKSYQAGIDAFSAMFHGMSEFARMRVRPELGISRADAGAIFGTVFEAMTDGVAKREAIFPGDLDDLRLPSGPAGEEETWSGLALTLLALGAFLFEPDPDLVAS